MFKQFIQFILLALLSQAAFSQDRTYWGYTNYSSLENAVFLLIKAEKREKGFQVTGTYYEYRGTTWLSVGTLSGTLYDNSKFKGEANIKNTPYNADGSAGYQEFIIQSGGIFTCFPADKNYSGIYYKDGNEKDVCRISQDGPFADFIDENSNTSKAFMTGPQSFWLIDWSKLADVTQDGAEFRVGFAQWLKNPKETKDFTGTWSTYWGKMYLVQNGMSVTGHYEYSNGVISNGTVTKSGDTLICRGDWKQDGNLHGNFVFKLLGDAYTGGYNVIERDPGVWFWDWGGRRILK
jgi:hypothetical protein